MQDTLKRKTELILERELLFANRVGAAVFEKPRASFWMVLVPILIIHFIYRMQKYRQGRLKFDEDFMVTRRRSMDVAAAAVEAGTEPDIDQVVRQSTLTEDLKPPYASWVQALVGYYMDLLAAQGDSFESLVRSAYRNRTEYLLILNRLNETEREFYAALKPQMEGVEGAATVITTIEERSRQLRRELAEHIFP